MVAMAGQARLPRRIFFPRAGVSQFFSAVLVFVLIGADARAQEDPAASPTRPNLVLVMIDDMGYGDLTCHGSPHVATPRLDGLHASSVRLTDFHVAPMCSPTRGQLLTGLDAMRNGSTIVASSRMMVRAEIPMLPAHLAAAGYATGHFGKWHLGENYPHRPADRGFQRSLSFPLQEISSLADHWGNDYFDPVLRDETGARRKFPGYVTDVLFDQAIAWMAEKRDQGVPFFCYLPLNVVHGPQWASAEDRAALAARFPKLRPGQIGYLAMLANADANFGRLEDFLEHQGLREDTIVVFLSDNGGYAMIGEYNAGMRDGKSRLAEGGHRVPCFIRWPKGQLGGAGQGRDLAGLAQVQDLAPTLLSLCGAPPLAGTRWDGISLVPGLRGEAQVPDRTLIVQYGPPEPFRMACVMQGTWRLLTDIKGRAQGEPELYDLARDPLQRRNLFATEVEKARSLRAAYDRWWSEVEPLTHKRAFISLGHPAGDPVNLSTAEWRENAMAGMSGLRSGVKRKGEWDVEVVRSGTYEIALRRWPEESGLGLRAAAPPWTPHDTQTPDHAGFPAGEALPIASARLKIGEQSESRPVADADLACVFRVPLIAGRTQLSAHFHDAAGKPLCPAYFVTARLVD